MRFPVLRARGGVLISSWTPHPALAHRPGNVHVQAQLAGELVAFLPEVAPTAAEPRDGLQAPLEAEESAPALDLALRVPRHRLGVVAAAPQARRAAPAAAADPEEQAEAPDGLRTEWQLGEGRAAPPVPDTAGTPG